MAAGRRTSAALVLLAACAAVAFTVLACTGPNPVYLSDAAFCSIGGRQCFSASQSLAVPVVCGLDKDGKLSLLRETCPSSAQCNDGRCVTAPGLPACSKQGDCKAHETCAPLVSGGQLATFCVSIDGGSQAPGDPCDSDDQCQSFLCLQHAIGKFCLDVCQVEADCGIPKVCRSFNVTVTGIQGSVRSCSSG